MKKLTALVVLGLSLAFSAAHAADDKAASGKKSKLAICSSEAKGLKGDEYKKKRDECMKGDAANASSAAAPAAAASPTCEKSAADKKLHGAAKTAHIKKCMADAK